MSLADLMASDVSNVFLNTSDFAEQVTQRPQGNSANDAPVTVVWNEQTTSQDYQRGEETVRRAMVSVAESVTCHRDDVWIKDDEIWAAVGDPPAAEGGMRVIRVERHETKSRKRAGGTIL